LLGLSLLVTLAKEGMTMICVTHVQSWDSVGLVCITLTAQSKT
jgi:ABC-type polar amino acid transport system ATPase subunit